MDLARRMCFIGRRKRWLRRLLLIALAASEVNEVPILSQLANVVEVDNLVRFAVVRGLGRLLPVAIGFIASLV